MKLTASLMTGLALLVSGCNSSSSPSAPAALVVEAFQTAIQPEPGGVRVQVRMRVVAGLAELASALQRNAVRARTCQAGECAEGQVGALFLEADCPAVAGALDFGAAWSEGDVVGVDFCAAEIEAGMAFETVVTSAGSQSNVVTTRCLQSTFGVTCGSG